MTFAGQVAARAPALEVQSALANRFRTGAIWSVVGAAASQGGNLVLSILVARLIGKELFGAYGMILSTTTLFGTIAGLGLGLTATKFVAELRQSAPERAGRIIGLSTLLTWSSTIVASGLLFFLAHSLSTSVMGSARYASALRLGSILLLFTTINGAQSGALGGFEAFRATAAANTARLAFLPLVAGLLMWKPNLNAAVAGTAVISAIPCCLNYFSIRRHCTKALIQVGYRSALREWPILIRFSIPVVLAGLLVGPVTWLTQASLLKRSGYSELAVFTAANQWRTIITFLPAIIGQLSVPLLSNLRLVSPTSYRRVIRWTVSWTILCAAAIALPVCLLSGQVMRLYGRGFSSASMVCVLLSVAGVLAAVNGALGAVLTSEGRLWASLFFNAAWAAVVLYSAHALIPQ